MASSMNKDQIWKPTRSKNLVKIQGKLNLLKVKEKYNAIWSATSGKIQFCSHMGETQNSEARKKRCLGVVNIIVQNDEFLLLCYLLIGDRKMENLH
ncbi:hypothetical protein CFP56_013518 [Quercus suber]|uniref:Uncharacterized protein n=1 Tax=Quercus suber TaxID=58331 RepID=A0AAW0KV90_QUESU